MWCAQSPVYTQVHIRLISAMSESFDQTSHSTIQHNESHTDSPQNRETCRISCWRTDEPAAAAADNQRPPVGGRDAAVMYTDLRSGGGTLTCTIRPATDQEPVQTVPNSGCWVVCCLKDGSKTPHRLKIRFMFVQWQRLLYLCFSSGCEFTLEFVQSIIFVGKR